MGRRPTVWNIQTTHRQPVPTRENSATPPYEEAFGTGRDLLINLGAERIVMSGFGTASVGLSAGYWNVEGNAVQVDGSTDEQAGDSTEMVIYPLQVQASYRLDTWAHIVPLAPVVRAGYSHYFWRILDGAGDIAQFSTGNEASGATQGWHAAFGVHLLLDFLDREMADDFTNDAGVENSYLTWNTGILESTILVPLTPFAWAMKLSCLASHSTCEPSSRHGTTHRIQS